MSKSLDNARVNPYLRAKIYAAADETYLSYIRIIFRTKMKRLYANLHFFIL